MTFWHPYLALSRPARELDLVQAGDCSECEAILGDNSVGFATGLAFPYTVDERPSCGRKIRVLFASTLVACLGTALLSPLRSHVLGIVRPRGTLQTFTASSIPTPIAWCTSGGGWRGEMVAIGFANAVYRAGLFGLDHFAALSANGGGSWFLALVAYSDDFYDNVTGPPATIYSFVETFMKRQYGAMNKKIPHGLNSTAIIADVCRVLNESGSRRVIGHLAAHRSTFGQLGDGGSIAHPRSGPRQQESARRFAHTLLHVPKMFAVRADV